MTIKKFTVLEFIRFFGIMENGEVDFFLGAGASINSGIPTANDMIWEFKKIIYCSENEKLQGMFKDLQSNDNRIKIQDYLDLKGAHPKQGDINEYSHYFEYCYNSNITRERYIQQKVKNILPSIGYLCLGKLITAAKVNTVWTVNFDSLLEKGINNIDADFDFEVFSSANKADKTTNLPSIYKLHGDYRYDRLKNTTNELKSLEQEMHKAFSSKLNHKALVVVGFSGRDDSIMNLLESNIAERDFLKYGLVWMIREGSKLPERVEKLMEQACRVNSASGVVEVSGFDDIMYHCYRQHGELDNKIENTYKETDRKKAIEFSLLDTTFIKFNTFVSISLPKPLCFKTDITSWSEFKKVRGNTIATFFRGYVYCFEKEDVIKQTFKEHMKYKTKYSDEFVKSDIELCNIDDEFASYKFCDNYTNILFSLMAKKLFTLGLKACKEDYSFDGIRKFYDSSKYKIVDNVKVYSAVELCLSMISQKYYLSLVPTVHITDLINDEVRKSIVNKSLSALFNKDYDNSLREWRKKILTVVEISGKKIRTLDFSTEDFNFQFNSTWLTSGKKEKKEDWPELQAYKQNEPLMVFDVDNKNTAISQLQGISKYGPLDYSYTSDKVIRPPIKLGIIAPKEDLRKIQTHLNSLQEQWQKYEKSKDLFIIKYNGFESIYKKGISICSGNTITYDSKDADILTPQKFLSMLKRYIDKLDNIDIAIIYIPRKFAHIREDGDFNLHDALKLYATSKDLKLQFIEERSVDYNDKCKVMWALSTSLYAKASGILWHPKILSQDTAFVGVSYAQSAEGICIGCSQLFDSTGTGMRLILKKVTDPQLISKNPFMKLDEARETMSALRQEYYKSNTTSCLNRIVVHKTTHFTNQEIQGFIQAFEGIDDIELLQIQEYSNWRGIRFRDDQINAHMFPIMRGTIVPLSEDSFLLWTNGSVISDELGKNMNYYKTARGIPNPLLIKRFYGKASGDVIAKEILMLTKMNWNSGDSLYKILPVTLDYAKTLSRMAKQKEALFNKPYDFRYFM